MGFPPMKVHCQPVGELVELSVKVTACPTQTVLALGVKAETGGETPPGTVSVISSTAKDGSVPTPSSLFTQRKPIFTLALLLHAGGKAKE